MAQALNKQENSMLFTTFYAKINTTQWFCLLFCAPDDDLARLTGAQNGPDAKKHQENCMFFTTFYAKIKKTKWFCLLFSAPVDDLARLTGLLVDRRSNLKK
jgi:hypothetical protein